MEFWQWHKEICKNCIYKQTSKVDNKIKYICKVSNNLCDLNNCHLLSKTIPPFISDGTSPKLISNPSNGGGCTLKQQQAFKLRNEGLKPKDIAIKMGISRQAVNKLISKASSKLHFRGLHLRVGGVAQKDTLGVAQEYIRLHDDNISFEIEEVDIKKLWEDLN